MTPIPRALTTSVLFDMFSLVYNIYIIYIHVYSLASILSLTSGIGCLHFALLFSCASSKLSCEKASLHQLSLSSFVSADYFHHSSMSNSDFSELVWENGQIVIKGGHFNKVSRVHNMDSFLNSNTGESGISSGFDGADVIPWFYHLNDHMFHHESGYGLVAETSGITNNGLVKDSTVSSLGFNGVNGVPNYVKNSDSLTDQLCLPHRPVEKQVNAMLPENDLKGTQVNDTNAQIESIGANKKISKPTAELPSMCSYSGLRASNNPTKDLKRKHSDEEDCESSSEDTQDESVSIRKTSSKRNRAAEVHNFNERKRREKINEKIRALQELIPNCNKVDKATMLDEAIEYLRLLQFQVQMMWMRPQMCPSPIMSQTHLQQFMPMGFGMGMVYQPQAGILDGSPGFPAHASCFRGSLNPHPQLWNVVQGLPPIWHGAPTTLMNPLTSTENPNSKDPHLAQV